jgi:hypothetical protein
MLISNRACGLALLFPDVLEPGLGHVSSRNLVIANQFALLKP